MARMQAAIGVLNQVQVLDQEVRGARAIAQERLDLGERRRLDLGALGPVAGLAPPRGRMERPAGRLAFHPARNPAAILRGNMDVHTLPRASSGPVRPGRLSPEIRALFRLVPPGRARAAFLSCRSCAGAAQSRPAPRAHLYLAPSTSTGSS